MPNLYGNFSARSEEETVVEVTSGSWIALPTTALAGRNLVEVYNKGENKLYLSFDSSATLKQRAAIGGGEFKIFPIQDVITLYGRSQGGGTRVIVTEYR